MSVDLCERELLAEPVPLPLVRVEVDRLRVDEGFIQAVELLLNRLGVALRVGSVAADDVLALVPRAKNSSQARSCVGRLRFSVCSFVLTRT